MNERIRDLAIKCGAYHQVYDQKRFMVSSNFDVEQFAELIVRECCSAIRLDDVFNGGKFQRTILKHFGVEE